MKFFLKTNAQKKLNTTGGFSLLEMLVATSLYVVAMLVIVGALISLESASRKARTIRVATDNVSAAIDSMSRTIRMGSYFHCGCTGTHAAISVPADCPINAAGTGVIAAGRGDTCLTFESQNGNPADVDDQYIYRLSGQQIQRSTNSGTSWLSMTAPEISIMQLAFYVGGTTLSGDQPYITMFISGSATSSLAKVSTSFDIQTTVSARTPNFLLTP